MFEFYLDITQYAQ